MHHRTDTEESAVFKPLAVAVGLGCAALSLGANAYQYGEYAGETLERLITDYPGRYRGTASFAGASELMQSRLGFGYQTSRQDFTWAGNRSSQNVIASAPGSSGKFLVLGAHYDTYYGRPTLQGLDDNASGAAVLTEIARNLGGIALENGLEVVGFGAEEEGLRGSRAYVESLDASQRANLQGMINLDSLVTGDKMYAHAGSNSVSSPALGAYREQILRIARELDIPLFTNPGLNAEYPAGTGCCSDGESFNGMDIPVLFIEATNWELGDLDGYEQTDNPAIPGGSTWHDPVEDNKEVLTNALGQERIEQRMRDFSRLLTRLVLELTNADLLASTASGGALARQMEDQLQRQHQALTRLHDRRWLTLLGSNRAGRQLRRRGGRGGRGLAGQRFRHAWRSGVQARRRASARRLPLQRGPDPRRQPGLPAQPRQAGPWRAHRGRHLAARPVRPVQRRRSGMAGRRAEPRAYPLRQQAFGLPPGRRRAGAARPASVGRHLGLVLGRPAGRRL